MAKALQHQERDNPEDKIGAPAIDEENLDALDQDIMKLRMRSSQALELESAPIDRELVDQRSLGLVLDGLSSQVLRLRQHCEIIRSTPTQDLKHQTFGGNNLSPQQKAWIAEVIQEKKREKSVPLEHAFVLVKHLVQMKTTNMELENYVKEMQAKLQENGVDVPSREKPENASSQEDQEDQNDEDEDDDYSDSDSDRAVPIQGNGLLEQIFNLQNMENANNLGLSQKQVSKSKPLAKKQANKLGQSQKPVMAAKSNNAKASATSSEKAPSTRSQKLQRHNQEQEKLYKVVEQAFQAQILDNDLQMQALDAFQEEQAQPKPEQAILQQNFEKMRAHFDCLSQLNATHGDLTSANRLREVLKQNCFLLGLESYKNKGLEQEVKFAKSMKERLRKEKLEIQQTSQNHESELEQVKSKLYDIEFDYY